MRCDLIPTDSGSDTQDIRDAPLQMWGGGGQKTGKNILQNQNFMKKKPALQRKKKERFSRLEKKLLHPCWVVKKNPYLYIKSTPPPPPSHFLWCIPDQKVQDIALISLVILPNLC